MRINSAVLRSVGATRPYTTSLPLTIEELELDGPGPGELLVRIEAAGVCHSDLSVVTGQRRRPLPMALGHEAAGVVLQVGEHVDDVTPGDHVVLVFVPSCGRCDHCSAGRPALCPVAAAANTAGELRAGGFRLRAPDDHEPSEPGAIHHHLGVSAFAGHAVVDRASAVVIDADVPFDVAAVLGCALLTGFGAVHNTAGVRPGETVTVIGLGGVGQAAVLGAVAAQASAIVAVDPVEHKRQLALDLGATHACAPADAATLVQDVLGSGTRWVFEAVGSAAVLEQAFALTGRGGTTVSIGLPPPDSSIRLPALAFAGEGKTMTGSYMGWAPDRGQRLDQAGALTRAPASESTRRPGGSVDMTTWWQQRGPSRHDLGLSVTVPTPGMGGDGGCQRLAARSQLVRRTTAGGRYGFKGNVHQFAVDVSVRLVRTLPFLPRLLSRSSGR